MNSNPAESRGDADPVLAKERWLLSVRQASAWLGIPAFTLYSWTLSRRIPHYKIGRRVMFSKDDVKRWVDRHHRKEAT